MANSIQNSNWYYKGVVLSATIAVFLIGFPRTLFSQTGCTPAKIILTLSGDDTGGKSAYNGLQLLSYAVSIDFQVFASHPSITGNIVKYKLDSLKGKFLYIGEAQEKTTLGLIYTQSWNTSATYDLWVPSLGGEVSYNTATGKIIQIKWSDSPPFGVSKPIIYSVAYSDITQIASVKIRLPSGWGFTETYTLSSKYQLPHLDTQAPVARCKDAVIQFNTLCYTTLNANQIDNGSSDNCGVADRKVNPSFFSLGSQGAHLATLTVADAHGNTDACTAIVQVEKPHMEFWTKNRFATNPKKLGESPSGDCTLQRIKVCADGSTDCSYLILSSVRNPKEYLFRIKEDPEGLDKQQFGNLVLSQGDNAQVTYSYYHPDGLYDAHHNPVNDLFKTLNIEVLNADKVVVAMVPIHLYRAPVLMVHGLWDKSASFQQLADLLTTTTNVGGAQNLPMWNPVLVSGLNYPNDQSFETNRNQVMLGIIYAIGTATNNGFSTNKVNVVAHSMGGILTRYFLQSDAYEDDICRFITIDSPQSGTQSANMLIDNWTLGTAFTHFTAGHDVYAGAVHDLQINSPALWDLNFGLNVPPNLNRHKVPTHAIVCHAKLQDAAYNEGGIWAKVVLRVLTARLGGPLSLPILNNIIGLGIFQGELHDVVVPVSSQSAGLPEECTTVFKESWHNAFTKSQPIQDWIRILLNNSPKSSLFAKDGFTPTKLNYLFDLPNIFFNGKGSESIISPASGTTYAPSDQVAIFTVGTGDVEQQIFWAGNSDLPLFFDRKVGQTNQFSYTVPKEAIGTIYFTAIGAKDSTWIALDTIQIQIWPDAVLEKIDAQPDTLFVFDQDLASLLVTGFFSDSVARSLTLLPDLQCEVADPAIAQLSKPGLVKGLKPGSTQIFFDFQEKKDTITVVVLAGGILLNPPNEPKQIIRSTPLLLEPNQPNPFSSHTQFSLIVRHGSNIIVEVFDLSGHKVATLAQQTFPVGTHLLTWDGYSDERSLVPPGLYTVRACTINGEISNVLKVLYFRE